MNPFLIPILGSSLLLAAQQAPEVKPPRLVGVIEVGTVFTDCDHVTQGGKPSPTPEGFSISPDSAFKLAHQAAKFRCPSKFGHTVYADKHFYYIRVGLVEGFLALANLDISPDTIRDSTISVHGKSGKITLPKNQ